MPGLYDQLTPAEIGQFDQERADIARTYTYCLGKVRAYRQEREGDEDLAEMFVALITDMRELDKTRLAALLVEGLIRNSVPMKEEDEHDV